MKNLSRFADMKHRQEAQITAEFVFNERIDVSLFKLGHEYVCICGGAHITYFWNPMI